MLRNMVTSFLEHERIVTTLHKAKEIRPLAEKIITLGKRDTLHARRQVDAYLLDPETTKKVFDTLAPRFGNRPGGYTRIVRLDYRVGDGAERAVIELLGSGLEEKKQKEAKESEDADDATDEANSEE
jgi:large subunit ribosomal protein L17